MNKFALVPLTCLFLFLTPAVPSGAETVGRTGLYVELGGKNQTDTTPGVVTGDIGIEHFDSSGHISARGGLSFYATDEKPDVLTGFDLGLRLHAGSSISPFIGIGLFAGSAEQETRADNDGIDNDNDGAIDEWGETKTEVKDVLAAFYPEAGIHIWLSPEIGLELSTKYHMTTEGPEYRYWIRSLGMSFWFP